MKRSGRTVEWRPIACRLLLEVDHVLVTASGLRRRRSERHTPTEPRREGLVVSRDAAVRQRDLGLPITTEPRRCEEQLRHAPPGESEASRKVVDCELTITFKAVPINRDRVDPFTLKRFHRIPPEFDDSHRKGPYARACSACNRRDRWRARSCGSSV